MVAGLLSAGCGDADDRLPPARSPAPTVSPTSTVDPVEADVLAALDVYIAAVIAAKTEPDPTGEGLVGLVEAPALGVIKDGIAADLRENRRYEGTIAIVWAEIIERNLDGRPDPHVVVETCMDPSNFLPVDIDTGELAGDDPREEPMKHRVRIQFHPSDDGGWEAGFVQWPNWFYGEREEYQPEC
jgi:hypothetical protein